MIFVKIQMRCSETHGKTLSTGQWIDCGGSKPPVVNHAVPRQNYHKRWRVGAIFDRLKDAGIRHLLVTSE